MTRRAKTRPKRKRRRLSWLERFRKANDVTPMRLAREAGVSRQQLYRIRMTRSRNLSLFTAMRIRDALGRMLLRSIAIEELFGDRRP